ncbi:MAG: hypothetical protein ACYC35_28560 [Pirellulales bacterium]
MAHGRSKHNGVFSVRRIMPVSAILAAIVTAGLWTATAVAETPSGGPVISGDPLPQILSDWQRRRTQANTIRYVAEGTYMVPKGAFDGDPALPKATNGIALKEDYTCPFSGDWLVDFAGNRFRMEVSSAIFSISSVSFSPTHDVWVFDGKELRCRMLGVSENRGKVYGRTQAEFAYHKLDYAVITMSNFPLFLAHGLMLTGATMQKIGNLRAPLDGTRVVAQGNAVSQGRSCVVLRTLPSARSAVFYELWVDVPRQSAVVRVQRYDGPGVLESNLDIEQEQKPQGWFPKQWRYTRLDTQKKLPSQIITAAVREFELNPKVGDDAFHIEPAAGMVVNDRRARTTYVVGPDGRKLSTDEAPPVRTSRLGIWLGMGALVVAGIVIACLVWRRRRAN